MPLVCSFFTLEFWVWPWSTMCLELKSPWVSFMHSCAWLLQHCACRLTLSTVTNCGVSWTLRPTSLEAWLGFGMYWVSYGSKCLRIRWRIECKILCVIALRSMLHLLLGSCISLYFCLVQSLLKISSLCSTRCSADASLWWPNFLELVP